jgi:long-chain fatty acid transport protein
MKKILTLSAVLALSLSAFATNGMNMEGYGPIAAAMGGCSIALDNGAAAFANNPATIGLMSRDGATLNLAVGVLAPSIESSVTEMPSMKAESAADMFIMPGFGYIMPRGRLTYGLAVFAQGGMGTEYDGDTFMSAGTGLTSMSQVGVGRAGIPLSYQVTDDFIVGGSLDLVWAQMDLQMAMPGMQFDTFVNPDNPMFGSMGQASGTMVSGLFGAIEAGMLNPAGPINWARFDFADESDFTGKAFGIGAAVKLGFVKQVTDQLTIGGTFHSKTAIGDLNTDDASITMSANYDDAILAGAWDPMGGVGAPAGTYSAVDVPVTGSIDVVDFQWPMTLGFGTAYQATDQLTLALDLKQVMWSDVMENFNMVFEADAEQGNPMAAGFAGSTMKMNMIQKWDDQLVVSAGLAYQMNPALNLRAGVNVSNNPVPDTYLNALFPAIIKEHFTFGAGYAITAQDAVDLSMVIAPEVEASAASGVTTTHSQMNIQLMYSRFF